MNIRVLIALIVLICVAQFAWSEAFQSRSGSDLNSLAKQAISSDSEQAKSAIAQLREMGPDGLKAMLDFHQAAIKQHPLTVVLGERCTPEWQRLATAIDTVAAQRDAWVSGLYWYTDLEQAERAAQQQHKPILSLRLLGKLDEEYSCANSRFFRTALYANKDIAAYLSQNFILHWKSVRPVP
ncbi:MAG TPA: hypothetical protein VL282_18595, partial [Tepidisphaeraceae bacterium]|nr:hypothetical protein [Tepidisphaeraceae bacterium]